MLAELLARVGHQLHPDADAQERRAARGGLLQRILHAVDRAQVRRARAERADAGEDYAIGRQHRVGVGGDEEVVAARGAQRVGDRVEVA